MRFSALLAALPAELRPSSLLLPTAASDPPIRGIAYDSRAVVPGDLFVALRGVDSDGHDYLAQAEKSGATALLV
jgi:UDP-N-acetylmuramoyl-L-alanyl-D-glutamate--2,6-diaminopimelate ligase